MTAPIDGLFFVSFHSVSPRARSRDPSPKTDERLLIQSQYPIHIPSLRGHLCAMTSLLNLQTARVKDKFKAWLRSRTDGALAMYALFKEMDSDGDDSLSWEEFQQVTKKLGYATTTADLRELFLQFDVNGDGSVNFEEFFRSMRGDMSPARRELITNTFNAIDADRDGVATLTDIGKLLNPKTTRL